MTACTRARGAFCHTAPCDAVVVPSQCWRCCLVFSSFYFLFISHWLSSSLFVFFPSNQSYPLILVIITPIHLLMYCNSLCNAGADLRAPCAVLCYLRSIYFCLFSYLPCVSKPKVLKTSHTYGCYRLARTRSRTLFTNNKHIPSSYSHTPSLRHAHCLLSPIVTHSYLISSHDSHHPLMPSTRH